MPGPNTQAINNAPAPVTTAPAPAVAAPQAQTKVRQTQSAVSQTLIGTLGQFHLLPGEVQGFTEYQFLGYPCRSPLQLNNILGPLFWRSFDANLITAIEDLKKSNEVEKGKLHATLLSKYFNIKDVKNLVADNLNVSDHPNAYNALPNENSEDYHLHLYFLQPFRLFGITEANRKFIGKDAATVNREWLWHKSAENTNAAPLFRKVMQAYILSDILDDYQDAKANPELKDPEIVNILPLLTAKHSQLLEEIKKDTKKLFKSVAQPVIAQENAPDQIINNPNGLINSSAFNLVVDEHMNGFMDITAMYPGGRLLFGQPSIEPHHAIAARDEVPGESKLKANAHYILSWIFVHFNLSTSFFWLQTVLKIFVTQSKAFKNYVTNPNAKLIDLFFQSLLFIPNAIIVVSTPLLVFMPWIYGITSIPFTLLRTLMMHGPFKFLKDFNLLKMVDALELAKDGLLFYFYALPFLNLIMGGLVVLLPAPLLTAGLVTSFILVAVVMAIVFRDVVFDFIYALASPNVMQLLGVAVFAGMGAYLGSAIFCKVVSPYIPQSVLNTAAWLATPLGFIAHGIEKIVRLIVGEQNTAINLQHIIPSANRQPGINMPKPEVKFVVPQALADEITSLFNKVGRLNQSFHLSVERKAAIKQCLNELDVTTAPSLDALNQAIKNAKDLVKDNFDPNEAQLMKQLFKHLQEKQVALDVKENQSIMIHGNAGNYQPSWQMLKVLHEQGIIQPDGKWKTPEGIVVPDQMLEKCKRIEALKPASPATAG